MQFLWLLSELRTPILNQIMQLITYCGQSIVIVIIICLLYWCVDKRFAYQLGFTYFTAGLCIQALKITFRIPRPWILDPSFQAVKSALPGATGYSFPSGHTQAATSLFMPIALNTKKRWLKVCATAAFLLIGFSRMYLGCHTPKDVLVSMAISIGFSWLIWHFQSFFLDDTRYVRPIAITLVILSSMIALYALLLMGNHVIDGKYAADCCEAAGAGLGFAVGWYVERTCLNFNTHTKHFLSQIVKLVIGLLVVLLLRSGIHMILGSSVLAKLVEYFILVLWIIILYPALFSLVSKKLGKK